ncbi:MAG TPA: amidohydrolase family protein [Phycisphaerae bacterium]|nr:amidohydrolase family protein [Phycisphaerae bacterium]HPM24316.1 amidohydrolase family protein [Phycisphaerae bacterium]
MRGAAVRLSDISRRGLMRAALLASCVVGAAYGADADGVIVLKAARIHTVAGETLENGAIVIEGGRITAVGPDVPIPEGARVMEHVDGVITPGLIDACCLIDSEIPQEARSWSYGAPPRSFWGALGEYARRQRDEPDPECDPIEDTARTLPDGLAAALPPQITWTEQSAEVTPHRRVLDSLNLFSNDFTRLARAGVTTVYVSADTANVIGNRGAIVKTAGPLAERVIRGVDAVKVTLGGDPTLRGTANLLPPSHGPAPSFLTRRPTTRMGVDWVFRKAFYDAQRVRAGLAIHGADMPPTEAVPVLLQVLDGEVPLRVQARMQHDIFSALRLAGEFKLKFTLEEATEAYRCLPQLKAAGVPVIFGPLYMTPTGFRAATDEVDRARLNTPAQLADAGIEFALTAQELRDEEGLVRQGMVAVRHGLTPELALRAMTATPASFMGLAGEVGVIAPRAAADVVVWSGEPFDAASRPVLVLVSGRVVYKD